MITLPYGIADFRRIRREGMAYVDRTAYIPRIERLGSTLVFLRPRRFGKSLWLQTLASYYDLRRADESASLFGDLAVGREPTPLANRSFVLHPGRPGVGRGTGAGTSLLRRLAAAPRRGPQAAQLRRGRGGSGAASG